MISLNQLKVWCLGQTIRVVALGEEEVVMDYNVLRNKLEDKTNDEVNNIDNNGTN